MTKYPGYVLSATTLTLAILGARLESNGILYFMLATIIVSLLLVVFDRIPEKQYPFLIFFMGLGLIYQLTLMSNYLVGTDIHYEYYFAVQTYNSGGWDSTIPHSYNSATAISVFLPAMAKLLGIPLVWAFKVIPPLFLAGIPVVTYYIFRREFDPKTAFLSVFFFISIPTMFLELSGLAKQAIGELFLVMCLGLVAYRVFDRRWARYVLIGLLAVLTAVSHYSMGGTLFAYLLGAVVLFPIGKYVFKMDSGINLKWLTLTVVVFTLIGTGFYSWAAQGSPLKDITASAGMTSGIIAGPTDILAEDTLMGMPNTGDRDGGSQYEHWVYPEPAVAVALGADFAQVGPVSKVFRIFQYTTQVLIVVGGIAILVRYKQRSLGYLVFLCLSGVLLGMVVFYPGFSPLFNATRFYNLILLFMAPAAIIGGKLVFRNYKALTIVLLIPYFLFTTGVVFEATQETDLTSITIPYSHALSANRIDTTGMFTDDDMEVRDWVKANDAFPVYGDLWGSAVLFEVQSNLGTEANTLLPDVDWYVNSFVYREGDSAPKPVPDDSYIYLRERNVDREEITYQSGVGLRRTRSYDDAGFRDVLAGRTILYQAGSAVVYGPKEEEG